MLSWPGKQQKHHRHFGTASGTQSLSFTVRKLSRAASLCPMFCPLCKGHVEGVAQQRCWDTNFSDIWKVPGREQHSATMCYTHTTILCDRATVSRKRRMHFSLMLWWCLGTWNPDGFHQQCFHLYVAKTRTRMKHKQASSHRSWSVHSSKKFALSFNLRTQVNKSILLMKLDYLDAFAVLFGCE